MAGDADNVCQNKHKESKLRLIVIVLGSFWLNFCSWGFTQSFGVLYIELLEIFGGTKDEAAWIQSIFSGILLASGPFAGVLLKKFGCRVASLVGSTLLFLGLFTSVFAPSLQVLYVTYGLLAGVGGSILFTAASVVVLEHFDKRASLAVGIAGSGASAGTIVIPLLSHVCIDAYGFRGTFLILSGVGLQCLVASLTFTPSPVHHEFDTDVEINIDASNTATKDADKTLNFEESKGNQNSKILSSCKSAFSFINAGYSIFSLSWAIVMLPFLVPFLFFPDIALERGVTKQEAAFIASSMGIGSLAGRAGFGFLGDVKRLETSLIHTVPVILFGALALVFNYVQGFTNFLILAILIGLLSAVFDGIHPVIVFQLVGAKHISMGLGLYYCLISVTTIFGTPIAGWIYESAGRYDETLYYCAGLSFIAAIVALYIPYWKRKRRRQSQNT